MFAGVAVVLAVGAVAWSLRPQISIPGESAALRRIGGGEAKEEKLDGTRMRVLVWNVEKGKESSFEEDVRKLQSEVDLAMLQEFSSAESVVRTVDAGMGFDMAASFVYVDTQEATGTATGCRARALSAAVQITKDVEPIVHTPKSTLITTYAMGSATLLVVNIHGRNRGGLEPLQAQLARLADLVKQHQGPVIFAGDFNTNSREKALFLSNWMKQLGMSEVTFHPDGRTVSKLSRQPLDHVFTRGLFVEDARSLAQVRGSDHQPILFTCHL